MAEWHIPPDYIVENWTDELLELMTEKLVDRKTHDIDSSHTTEHGVQKVSDTELFKMMGNKVKVEKVHGD